jgi:hypothetical protein
MCGSDRRCGELFSYVDLEEREFCERLTDFRGSGVMAIL